MYAVYTTSMHVHGRAPISVHCIFQKAPPGISEAPACHTRPAASTCQMGCGGGKQCGHNGAMPTVAHSPVPKVGIQVEEVDVSTQSLCQDVPRDGVPVKALVLLRLCNATVDNLPAVCWKPRDCLRGDVCIYVKSSRMHTYHARVAVNRECAAVGALGKHLGNNELFNAKDYPILEADAHCSAVCRGC